MPTHVHAFYTGWQLFFVVIWFVLLKAASMDLQPLQRLVNDAVLECLTLAKITIKEAAPLCGMSETSFYRALSGDEKRNISLVHLFCLPYRFWLHFGPMLMWMVAKKHAREIAETFTVRRSA